MTWHRLTIRQAARLLNSGLVTSEELAAFCHAVAMAGEEIWGLNAFSRLVPLDDLLHQARASDERRRINENKSIFEGIPISVKANLAVATQPLTAGSKILGSTNREALPCGYDADTVRILLRESGAVLVGITNMDEFGMGSLGSNVSSLHSRKAYTKNPIQYLSSLSLTPSGSDDLSMTEMIKMTSDDIMEAHTIAYDKQEESFSAGGSSCGSAASVAHGSSLLSLGTDTGGSVRLPAAWCGIVGLKPSYGLLSRHGVVSYASSFDTVGILAPSVDCASLALDRLAQRGEISRDSTSSYYDDLTSVVPSSALGTTTPSTSMDLEGTRIGIPSSFSVEECPPDIKHAWSQAAEWLLKHGASIEILSTEDVSPLLVQKALAAYYVLVSAEASSNLSRYDGFRYGMDFEDNMEIPTFDSDLTPLERRFASTRMRGFGSEVARRILCGTSVLSADRFHTHYEGAARLRAHLAQQLKSCLETRVDAILIPTVLSRPCSLEREPLDNTEMFANDVMTVPASLAGLPAISVPSPLAGEAIYKAGLQIIGSRLREDSMLRVAQVVESMNKV